VRRDEWQTEYGQGLLGKRVLVTGATGFVGGHLCQALSLLGAEIIALSRCAQASSCEETCWCQADLRDLEDVRALVRTQQPQLVFHVAGLVNTRQDRALLHPMIEHNVIGTVNLLLALTETGCERVVLLGSSEEPFDVAHVAPNSPYAASKMASSMYGRMFHGLYDLPVVIARLFMSYGPGQSPEKLIPYTILSLLQGHSPRLSSGTRVCDMIFILDLIRGLLHAGLLPHIAGQTVDIGTGQQTSVREVVELLAEMIDSTAHPLFGEMPDRKYEFLQVAERPLQLATGPWAPRWSLREGLAETIAWYAAHQAEFTRC